MDNVRKTLGGNSHLSPKGQLYAKVLPEFIRERVPNAKAKTIGAAAPHELEDVTAMPFLVWTSTLNRTMETAAHLPVEYSITHIGRLDEIDSGALCTGLTYEEVGQQYPEEYAARKEDKLGYRYPHGGELRQMMPTDPPLCLPSANAALALSLFC